jgi:hypothetical protein
MTQSFTEGPDKTPSEDPALKRSTRRRTKSRVCPESSRRRTTERPMDTKSTMIKRLRISMPLRTMLKRAVL